MIPRTLVPTEVSPPREMEPSTARRLATPLDSRVLLAPGTATGPLEEKTSIPAHIPLDVLAKRTLVPKDLPPLPLELRGQRTSRTRLDARIVVPAHAEPAPLKLNVPDGTGLLPSVLEPDVFTTGQVHLLPRSVEARVPIGQWRVALVSVALHALLVLLIVLQPKLFPHQPWLAGENEEFRQLGMVYLPPQAQAVPAEPIAPRPPAPKISIDPRLFRENAPETDREITVPGPPDKEKERGEPEPSLPAAPTPQPDTRSAAERQREMVRLEPVKPPAPGEGSRLDLGGPTETSPGKALEQSLREAMRGPVGGTGDFGGPIPPRPGGGGGQGYLNGAVQLLTPTEGVDFSNYLARVLASVRRNWYAVIPESARLGEKGLVVIQFRILRNGAVPHPEPNLVRTSGREPLDRAALSSIRASNPFEPLPPAFSGPFIELRFIYLYNLPRDVLNQ